jgi:putative transposase
MRKARFTTEQIVAILHGAEAGALIRDLCSRHGVTETMFYQWRRKYGGLQTSEAGGSRRSRTRIGASSDSWRIRR